MNNTLVNKNIADVSHSVRKIRVEEEGVLPDYCSDIVRILRVEACPVISENKTRVQDGNVLFDVLGRVDFNLIYAGNEGHSESYGFSCNFAENFKSLLPSGIDEESISCTVVPMVENSVCKVQNPRKVVVRCDIVLDAAVKGNTLFESINTESYEKEGKTEIKKEGCKLALLVSSVFDSFEYSEEIKLPASLPPMERILSCNSTVSLENTSLTNNALNFWGTLGIYCIYLPESDMEGAISPQSFYQPIEISGRIETDSTENDLWAMGMLLPAGISFEILPDNFGENRILKVNGCYSAKFDIIGNDDAELTKDIYGVGCELEANEEKRSLIKFIGTLKESSAIRETIPLKEGTERVEGCRADIKLVSKGIENGKLFADYKVEITAIGCTKEGESGIKETLNVHLPLNLPSEISDLDKIYPIITAYAPFVDCKVSGTRGEVNFDITTVAHIFEERDETFVSAVSFKENKEERDSRIFYYPSVDDSLWSIGKRYGVSIKDLKEKNGDDIKRVMII